MLRPASSLRSSGTDSAESLQLGDKTVRGLPVAARQNPWADVIDDGTASQARKVGFTMPAAGKTGTTNDYHDAWFNIARWSTRNISFAAQSRSRFAALTTTVGSSTLSWSARSEPAVCRP